MSIWYDRNGKPIPGTELNLNDPRWLKAMEEVEKLLRDKKYCVVQQNFTPDKHFWVSTVWLGLDHSFSIKHIDVVNPKPLIFETMVFDNRWKKRDGYEYRESVEQDRYTTEKQARFGHKKLLKEYSDMERLGENWKR